MNVRQFIPSICVSIGLFFGFLASDLLASEKKTLLIDGPAERPAAMYMQNVLEMAYSELGYQLSYSSVPLARSYIEADHGKLDGLRGRVEDIEFDFPNLIQLPVPLLSFDLILVIDEKQCTGCDLKDLNNVGSVRGFRALDNFLENTALPFEIVRFTSQSQTIEMLISGKIQGAIVAEAMLTDASIENIDHWRTFPLTKVDIYHYLHKKNQGLVAPLTDILNQMDKNGELAKLKVHFKLQDSGTSASYLQL